MQSDIMIVKMSDTDYYVSEKLHDKEPYYKLLVNRSQNSKHYTSLSEARIMAEKMKANIIITSPDCNIIEIDIAQYPKNGKQNNVVEFEYTEDNQIAFGINSKGKKVFELPQDVPYLYVDKIKYREGLVKKQLSIANNKDELNFRNLGEARAYDLAYDCALPYLRYEIYKAQKLVQSLEYDLKLYQFDVEFYLGYIYGLNEAITIQKDSVLELRSDWLIHIFGLKNEYNFELAPKDTNEVFGEYDLTIHTATDNCVVSNKPNEIFVFFVEKSITELEFIYHLRASTPYLVVVYKNKKSKPITNKYIESIVQKLFKLGKGDGDLKIDEQGSFSEKVDTETIGENL